MPKIPDIASEANIRYRWIIAASLLLSIWLIWLDPLINRDAIIYLRAAEAYLRDGVAASQQIFGRPLLPICIATLHQLTGIPLLYAGLLITTAFYVVLCVAFVDTVRVLGGKRSVQLIAAIVILSHPWINHTRASIMRDPIYLAFVVLSLREMLLFIHAPGMTRQLRWVTYIVLATLFRFEGVFLAAMAPLALLFTREVDQPRRRCMQLLVPQLLLCGLGVVALYSYQKLNPAAPVLFPGIGLYLERLLAFPHTFAELARQSAEPMLMFTARDDAPIAAVAALAAVLILNLCRAITWPWVIVLLWGARAGIGHRFRRDDLVLIYGYLFITLAYLSTFVAINRFMLERYTSQAAIFLLLFLPFFLSSLWHRGSWKKYLVLAVLLGTSADTLHSNTRDKVFIVNATRWVAENTPADASLVTNEKYIAHFSRRDADWESLQRKRFKLETILDTPALWQKCDYLVMYLKRTQEPRWQQFLQENGFQELKSFQGRRKGRAVIVATAPTGLPRQPDVD
ncbi:hypothetical protein [Pseudohalioglobus lutimaris]|uniref:Glycosyltransferase RgtA/B/C/D-like domain-containing protein n=1 Tax=Pseudohalioglobus lutimaris TaxID=1737061 RepID=A0A2N5X8K4_9GAMM|nr:hypothetical protein [Pseudohalioglobus lutimaris]PLW70825.1 hypothetical protein C0039_01470 [Pseudohalioglobus lutimaris]